jgi:LDH2 family malate/lactate/ureidoglycolate dehydrogenase
MRFAYKPLLELSNTLLQRAGMDSDKTAVVSEILLLGDILGHDTHGLKLLPQYVGELESGGMTGKGSYSVVSQNGAVAVWDGNYHCGVWLTASALDYAAERAKEFGVGTVAIKHSHHIACLQSYLTRAAERGLIAFVTCSDPANSAVAPFGGVEPLLSPDPYALGIPTHHSPILVDMSSSITTNGMTGRLAAAGQKLRCKWVQDADGNASDDPQVLTADPPGSLLPVGGLDHGHKGYNLALSVECLTQGLSGYGRKDKPQRWTASVLVQVYDPAMFAGLVEFTEQTDYIAKLCRASKPRPGNPAVRMPGDTEMSRMREAQVKGVPLIDSIVESLSTTAARFKLPFPAPLAGD